MKITRSKFQTGNQSGFTLIELLVVIAVIGILAAILFPVFARARENARRASCQSNLKQIGLGLMQYIQDFDERTPFNYYSGISIYWDVPLYTTQDVNWVKSIYPYTKSWNLYQCPSVPQHTNNVSGLAVNGLNDIGYFANGVVMQRNVAVIPNASEIIWAQENTLRFGPAILRPTPGTGTLAGAYGPGTYKGAIYQTISKVHFDGGNLLFTDGHVKWRKQSDIKWLEFGLGGGNVGATGDATTTATSLW